MRILFSGVPAYGHLLPLASLIAAARSDGHTTGLLTSAGMTDMITTELPPGVEHLPAGPMPLEFSEETAARTGANVFQPTPETIGEIFGGTRLDRTADAATDLVREWCPDVIVADAFDTVGPLLAATIDVPWHQVGLGPALPTLIVDEINRAAFDRYARRGLTPVPARTYIDPCPSILQEPDWACPLPRIPLRPQAHRRPGAPALELALPPAGTPRVLITLGTIFSEPHLLTEIVDAVRAHEVDVVVTEGFSIHDPSRTARAASTEAIINGTKTTAVHRIPFTPLAELLGDTDIVIGAGGSGTVLSALTHGLPMILWPQGADQEITAARATAGGVARTVRNSSEITPALAALLSDDSYRHAATKVATEIASLPGPHDVLAALIKASGRDIIEQDPS
ncbi:glycosyltransferase [Nocardia barduliensis]|uniref:glycosyltransferase n=1 Tax=Nocardia barduliensis TaxID=2736643 RepID=UPI001574B829|nr:glycosyltransferase [Nocardia barduliensis]